MQQELSRLLNDGIAPPAPGGAYDAVNARANVAYVAIQFPIIENEFYFQGRLGDSLSTGEGIEAAKLCAINILKQVHYHIGMNNVEGLNHLDICLQHGKHWDEGPLVADGASKMFSSLLGGKGRHSRSIYGVEHLPRNFCVGITATFTIANGGQPE
jgi:hypothetical protein